MGRRRTGMFRWMFRREEGQTLAEYAMILLFVAVACVAALTLLGAPIRMFYNGFNGGF
jgi:Flp pilus assembly pilin Flp